MQQNPQYADVVAEVRSFFERRVRAAQEAGIAPQRICLDPGLGFGKTAAHCMALLEHLAELRIGGLPLMMALSRKRFLKEYFAGFSEPQRTVEASCVRRPTGRISTACMMWRPSGARWIRSPCLGSPPLSDKGRCGAISAAGRSWRWLPERCPCLNPGWCRLRCRGLGK